MKPPPRMSAGGGASPRRTNSSYTYAVEVLDVSKEIKERPGGVELLIAASVEKPSSESRPLFEAFHVLLTRKDDSGRREDLVSNVGTDETQETQALHCPARPCRRSMGFYVGPTCWSFVVGLG